MVTDKIIDKNLFDKIKFRVVQSFADKHLHQCDPNTQITSLRRVLEQENPNIFCLLCISCGQKIA